MVTFINLIISIIVLVFLAVVPTGVTRILFSIKVTKIVKMNYKGNYAEYSKVDPAYEKLGLPTKSGRNTMIRGRIESDFLFGKLNFDNKIKRLHRFFLLTIIFEIAISIIIFIALLLKL